METKIITPEIEILNFLNEHTGSKFRPIKANLSKIKALLNTGFTENELKQVIALKIKQWLNNPEMAKYLRPSTLFRESNFEGYINEIEKIKQNPKLYAEYFNQKDAEPTNSNARAFGKIDAMFGRK
ncbi:MAG: conserved phage C-terminal domain-containing protein [Bergeyella cardium]|nr:MAG TPA: hypothetical protein [Caudoviricetes sp.]